ncbi:hypothetical protein BGZ49_010725 [Haplosporangium sp. Z 27]|nr:hypothetical protein BGZ49_010725 [Haplosporangium sp. Z 27]
MSYAELSKRDSPSTHRPRHFLAGQDNESDLEDMMTDSAIAGTPPLDTEFDSGDDDGDDTDSFDPSMVSPVSLLSFQPVSILQRKRKDSQEHVSAIHLLNRNQTSQQELGHQHHVPSLDDCRSKGARGRRPTVTFNLDVDEYEPCSSSPPARLNIQRSLFCNDDKVHIPDEKDSQVSEVSEAVQKAERALRRVSISLAEDDHDSDDDNDGDNGGDNGGDSDDDQDQEAQESDTIHASTTVVQNISEHVSSNVNVTSTTTTTNEINHPQEMILSHILTEAAPQDMLVALFDRPTELEALAARHSDFFNLMYCSLSKTSRDEFKKMLFKPRELLSDSDWMSYITKQLGSSPYIIEKFKDIVGWIGPDSEDEEDALWGEDEYGCRDSSFENVQIKWFRDIPDFTLETFQECYPQFFINARERLEGKRMSYGGDQRDQYVIFCEILSLTRKELPCDNAWLRRMNCCLEKYPELLLQLKEIIAYEVEYDA